MCVYYTYSYIHISHTCVCMYEYTYVCIYVYMTKKYCMHLRLSSAISLASSSLSGARKKIYIAKKKMHAPAVLLSHQPCLSFALERKVVPLL